MIGILDSYHEDKTPGNYQEEYIPVILKFFDKIFESRVYHVAQNDFPRSVNDCDGWIITGSPRSCYDGDEWLKKLSTFINEAHRNKSKLFGICFGHQIIAHSLGGRTLRSEKGWGIGVREIKIIEHKPWMEPGLEDIKLIFSHQDQVVQLPSEAKLLGQSEFCPNEMYSIGEHIFSIQGHPEVTKDFALNRLESRLEEIGELASCIARESLNSQSPDNDIVGAWVKSFFS